MAATRSKGPKCSRCGGKTYISTWGTGPVHRITYCETCNKLPGSCTCRPTSYVGRRRRGT